MLRDPRMTLRTGNFGPHQPSFFNHRVDYPRCYQGRASHGIKALLPDIRTQCLMGRIWQDLAFVPNVSTIPHISHSRAYSQLTQSGLPVYRRFWLDTRMGPRHIFSCIRPFILSVALSFCFVYVYERTPPSDALVLHAPQKCTCWISRMS
ncbi:hypothetical protein EV421DRAFT_169200 [Armillaria borealis]|uniref:Uncharacterized protein n=1 Tax=Armillaria borealis TaxID=47425 RepID=A0AA39IVW7_9AGAR|nr:hypothetical protein EV421DRAFT_169200 [Armillaria borealis]